jgi:hypothetical protein
MPENFGRFSVGPDGRFVPATSRPKFRLLADFGFEDPQGRLWEVPAGTEVDGASIPRIFWTLFGGPFEGNYIHASVVHDHFCVTRTRSAESTHKTFYFGMRANRVPESTAKKMYSAVATFGPRWRLRSGGPEGSGELVVESLPELDLDDPAKRERADRMFYAIAESLDASGGSEFTTSDGGMAEASLENLEAEADRLRASLAGTGATP